MGLCSVIHVNLEGCGRSVIIDVVYILLGTDASYKAVCTTLYLWNDWAQKGRGFKAESEKVLVYPVSHKYLAFIFFCFR
jgi:hypothetical protein